ncbi:hypothetical protein AB1N83_013181 [Pleurotus pulmonarius]
MRNGVGKRREMEREREGKKGSEKPTEYMEDVKSSLRSDPCPLIPTHAPCRLRERFLRILAPSTPSTWPREHPTAFKRAPTRNQLSRTPQIATTTTFRRRPKACTPVDR